MASQKAVASGPATIKNDGGVVVNGGTLEANSPMTVNKTLIDLADGSTAYGSVLTEADRHAAAGTPADHAGLVKAKSSGTFNFVPNSQEGERNFLIRGAGTNDDGNAGINQVNNTASTLLSVPGSEVALRTVSPQTLIVSTRQMGESANADGSTSTVRAFNFFARPSTAMVPGRTKGDDAGTSSTFKNPEDGTPAVADEILPTRGVPGELTFMFGAANPTNVEDETDVNYKARDAAES